MKLVRIFASLLAFATLGLTGFNYGANLFIFLLPMAVASLPALLVGTGLVTHSTLKLERVLTAYALLAVASLIALTTTNPLAKGGMVLLALAIGSSLLALRASYVTAHRRRYGLSSYYS